MMCDQGVGLSGHAQTQCAVARLRDGRFTLVDQSADLSAGASVASLTQRLALAMGGVRSDCDGFSIGLHEVNWPNWFTLVSLGLESSWRSLDLLERLQVWLGDAAKRAGLSIVEVRGQCEDGFEMVLADTLQWRLRKSVSMDAPLAALGYEVQGARLLYDGSVVQIPAAYPGGYIEDFPLLGALVDSRLLDVRTVDLSAHVVAAAQAVARDLGPPGRVICSLQEFVAEPAVARLAAIGRRLGSWPHDLSWALVTARIGSGQVSRDAFDVINAVKGWAESLVRPRSVPRSIWIQCRIRSSAQGQAKDFAPVELSFPFTSGRLEQVVRELEVFVSDRHSAVAMVGQRDGLGLARKLRLMLGVSPRL